MQDETRITFEVEVERLTLARESDEPVLAYCSLLVAGWLAVRGCKLIAGVGRMFVAFPAVPRKISCRACRRKVRPAPCCAQCGCNLPAEEYRSAEHISTVAPISAAAREAVERAVLLAYRQEVETVRAAHTDRHAEAQEVAS